MTMNKTDIQKELLKNKARAEFSHYCAGSLYYKVALSEGTFEFPVATVETKSVGTVDKNGNPFDSLNLSSDLGTTRFDANQPASMLWRWISKAIDSGEFVKIG